MPELVVDPNLHAHEIARFLRCIVRRPDTDPADPSAVTCAIWTGAIADDGDGRFSITRDRREYTVKPHRYATALALGMPVRARAVIEHAAVPWTSAEPPSAPEATSRVRRCEVPPVARSACYLAGAGSPVSAGVAG